MRQFSMGMVYALPSAANPTPVPFAIATGIKWDPSQKVEYISGQMETAIDAGGGQVTNAISIDSMDFRASMLGMLLSGVVTTSGGVLPTVSEPATIGATPFQYVPVQGAAFKEDAGVLDLTAVKWLTRVPSAPATGQYSVVGPAAGATGSITTTVLTITVAPTSGSFQVGQQVTGGTTLAGTFIVSLGTGLGGAGTYNVNTSQTVTSTTISGLGTYTFAAADTLHNLSVSYSYTTALGFTSTYTNQTMRPKTGFLLRAYNQGNVGGVLRNLGVDFPNFISEGLSMALKSGSWATQGFKGQAIQDTGSLVVWRAYVGE